jgi:hypothetical protein
MISERTPFYLISVIFLFITIVLSLVTTFNTNKNSNDFYPLGGTYHNMPIHDKHVTDKICWYFSQLTHHTLFLLFGYFVLALLNIKSVKFFKMVGPLALTVSVLYFYFLYPKQSLKIHQLSFYNFFSHFMIIFLVFCEFMYIETYDFHETTNCFVLIISSILSILINYYLRGVWSYDMIKLDTFRGWKLVAETTIIMYLFSMMFYIFKYKNQNYYGLDSVDLTRSFSVISGLVNIIYVLIFASYNKDIV